jgi:hypothetical protein
MPSKIYLVGSSHLNFLGFTLYKDIIAKLKPDNVTVEASEEQISKILAIHADLDKVVDSILVNDLHKDFKPDTVRKVVEIIGWEYLAPRSLGYNVLPTYTENNLVHPNPTPEGYFNHTIGQLHLFNIMSHSFNPKLIYETEMDAYNPADIITMNREMAEKIKSLDGTVVHCGGLIHLYPPDERFGPSLPELLKEYNPIKINLLFGKDFTPLYTPILSKPLRSLCKLSGLINGSSADVHEKNHHHSGDHGHSDSYHHH